MFEIDWTMDLGQFIGLIGVGFVVGGLSGLFGVGGGFLLTPLLHVLFGVPYALAVGSTLAQMVPTASFGTWKHWRLGHVAAGVGGILALGGLVGTELGVRLQQALRGLPDLVVGSRAFAGFDIGMDLLFLTLLFAVGLAMWVETRPRLRPSDAREEAASAEARPASHEPRSSRLRRWCGSVSVGPFVTLPFGTRPRISLWVLVAVGVVKGLLTGLMGVGGAFVGLPLLIYGLGFPTLLAVGTSSLQVLVGAVHGGARYFLLGDVFLPLVGALLLGSLAGVRLGVIASRRLSGARLRRAFALLVMVSGLVIGLDFVRQLL